jgi:hypothetical protein
VTYGYRAATLRLDTVKRSGYLSGTNGCSSEPYHAVHSGGSQKLEFRYDYLGRRIEKKVFTTAGATTPVQHVKYVYDGWNLIAEVNGAAPVTT